ncbi:hypothetical protein PAXINDRAFT_86367 [Paxillus involutus ATCC 200175]|uniref:RNase H type-1 domain-containing protein n=1 Tax=Paxillus involutus ATCC 200175 TaxID=664439 RepID=A0A0C9SR85_PAXIN|nr:hypothetical protein PAXINDRAFT_86367 [Paxillus involutus ATCC 200175]
MFETKPGHYIIDHFCRAIGKLRRRNKLTKADITIRWISGHDGVEGNKRADKEAKEAAKSRTNNSRRKHLPKFLQGDPLPLSISAVRQHQKDIMKKRWAKLWAKSPRFIHSASYDRNMLSGSYVKLISALPRRHASLLIWLRTKHIALNTHLHHIAKADTPYCPHCPGIREDIPHFILKCPQYARERQILTRHLHR